MLAQGKGVARWAFSTPIAHLFLLQLQMFNDDIYDDLLL
jgi:hypothetical protein